MDFKRTIYTNEGLCHMELSNDDYQFIIESNGDLSYCSDMKSLKYKDLLEYSNVLLQVVVAAVNFKERNEYTKGVKL